LGLVQKYSCKSSQKTQLTLTVWVKKTIKNYQIMLNEILNLEGVAVLSKEQQKSVNGGRRFWGTEVTYGSTNRNDETGICYRAVYNQYFVLGIATDEKHEVDSQEWPCDKIN
jgi:hypothetical protein